MTETLAYQVVLDAANAVNNARSFRSSIEDIERAAKPTMFSGFGGAATTAFNAVKSGAATALNAILSLTGPIATVTAGLTAMTAVGSSAQWEKQMSGVFKTTDLDRGTAAAVQMNDELLDLYANMRGVGKEGITSVAQGLGSLGIANAEIKDTTKTVLEASAAFGMLPEQSMSALATITNLWKGQTQEMGGVANMMQHIGSATNELGNKSKATEPNVLNFLAAVGGYATMYGETAQDTAALGALFESVGVNAADAETAMRSALQAGLFQSHKPAEDIAQLLGMPLNKSGKAESVMGYDVASRLLGIDTAEMRKRMETDLYGTMVDVASALKSKGLSETQQTQVAELIFGGYASAHWLKLAGQGEELDRLTGISREGFQSGTSMSQEYNRQTDNLIDTLGEFKNTLDVAAITAFTAALEPAKNKIAEMAQWVRDVTPKVKEFFNALWSGDWSKVNQSLSGFKSKALDAFKVVAGAAGVGLVVKGIATIGPTVLGVGKYFATMAATAVFNLAMTAGGWAASAASAVAAQLAFVGAWAALLGPITGVVAGIGLVAAGLAAIGYSLDPGKFTTFNKVALDAFNGIKKVVTDVWDLIQKGDWQGVANRLKQAFGDGISFVKNLPWKELGSEVITMVSDGAKAIVDGAFKLGDWVHDEVRSWISAGGPRQLGRDIADGIGAGIQWVIDSSSGGLDQAFGTVTEWLSIGWDIAKGIGEGIFEKIYENVQPVANEILYQFIKVVLSISAEFAKGWNTILVGAAKAAEGISGVFSTVGTKIAEYLQPAVSAISKLSGASPLGYYNKDSGVYLTPEQYAARENKAGFNARYATSGMADTVALQYQSQPIAGTNNRIIGTTVYDAETEEPRALPANMVGGGTSWSVLSPLEALLNWAGYRTGGQGFISSELLSPSSGNVKMTTDKGDSVTLSGQEVLAKSWFDIISPYTADYITNIDQSAKAIADYWIPAAKKSGNSLAGGGESAGDSIKGGASSAMDEVKTKTKDATDMFSNGVSSTGKGMADLLNVLLGDVSKTISSASQVLATKSEAGARALQIGSEVAAKIHSDGIQNAVTLYQNANGQVCAAIGSVGQKFQASGSAVSGNLNQSGLNWQNTSQSVNLSTLSTGQAVNQSTLSAAQTVNTQKINAQNQANALQLSGINQSGSVWGSRVSSSVEPVRIGAAYLGEQGTLAGKALATGAGYVSGAFSAFHAKYEQLMSGGSGSSSSGTTNFSSTYGSNIHTEEGVDCVCGQAYIDAVIASTGPLATAGLGVTARTNGSISASGSTSVGYTGGGSMTYPAVISGWSGGSPWEGTPWAAQGADITEHQLVHVGEKGPELILDPKIRNTIMKLTAMGFASMESGGRGQVQTTIEPADVYLDGQKVGRIVFKVGTSRMRRKGLSVK